MQVTQKHRADHRVQRLHCRQHAERAPAVAATQFRTTIANQTVRECQVEHRQKITTPHQH